ncbi:MAG TPA: gamma-glutamyl-gamma-aminobutyrate hydrolase family protein, partial [Prevotella sp.]
MEPFCLEQHLNGIYSSFPEAKRKVVIGITANHEGIDATLRERYYMQVAAAGGVPVIIPPIADTDILINTLDGIDGLLLTGGADINPLWGDDEPQPGLHAINSRRDLPELLITRLAYNRQIPILGICRG